MHAHDIDVSDNYSKTPGDLWQYCKNEAVINAVNYNAVDFNAASATNNSVKIKEKKWQVKQALIAQKVLE